MEEINTAQPSSTESNTTTEGTGGSESLVDKLNKPVTRRDFLKGLGITIAAGALASCAPKSMLEASSEKDYFKENIRELNRQFDLEKDNFLREDEFFNYERFIQQYPGFENYKEFIEDSSIAISRTYGVHPNAMRALASSIVASNINNQDPIKIGDQFNQRVGVMQFYPVHLFENDRIKKDSKFPSSTTQLAEPEANIKFGLQYLVEGLKEIKNDGENRSVMQLMLAQYYGKDALVDVVKYNREIKEDDNLITNYEKFVNTLRALGTTPKAYGKEVINAEQGVAQVLNRAIDNWHLSKFGEYKDLYVKQVDEYFKEAKIHSPDISKAELMAVFLAVARAESKGGLIKEIKDTNVPKELRALGWYQIVPKWRHLEDFNVEKKKNYTYDDLINNDVASIEVGIWTLMRYRNEVDILESMKRFKGGWAFGNFPDDNLWWNRVAYGINLLTGENSFNMDYVDYLEPENIYDSAGNFVKTVWRGPYLASTFESSKNIGVMKPDPKEEA